MFGSSVLTVTEQSDQYGASRHSAAFSGRGAAIRRHKKILVAHESIIALARYQTTSFGAVGDFADGKATVSTDSVACDLVLGWF